MTNSLSNPTSSNMPLLAELIDGLDVTITGSITDVSIAGLVQDSRHCKANYLFAALPGVASNGDAFIGHGVANGATIILTGLDVALPSDLDHAALIIIQAKEPAALLGQLLYRFYTAMGLRYPRVIAAVTGTNGKSSVVHFCRQLWQLMHQESASVGTLGIATGFHHIPAVHHLTTPDVVSLHQELLTLAAKDIDYVALEASSHGLDQHRLAGLPIKIAAFTNFSQDHLDYHSSLEHYKATKLRLITDILADDGVVIAHADEEWVEDIKACCDSHNYPLITVGKQGNSIAVKQHALHDDKQQLHLTVLGREYECIVPLIGDFQADNLLVAAAITSASGMHMDDIIYHMSEVMPVPGRMEMLRHANGAKIIIDYAHTPDGLSHALTSLRAFTGGKLITVFGCGGNRDSQKRAQMGAVAAELADHIIVTDDNPRHEDAGDIRRDILQACPQADNIHGRQKAITKAIGLLGANDSLLIAGKGHENYQIVGDDYLEFSDKKVVEFVLSALS